MLVLTRKVGEGIKIGDDVVIRVIQVKGKQVRIGVQAPRETKVQRDELEKEPSQNKETTSTTTSQEPSATSTKNEL